MKKQKHGIVIKNFFNFADIAEKEFGSTAQLNRDLSKLLPLNNNFIEDIKNIRRKYKIPKLNSEKDRVDITVLVEGEDEDIDVSDWVYGLSKKEKKEFYSEINILIKDHSLPVNFNEWLEHYILYGNPKYDPLYPRAWLSDALRHDSEILRYVRLTTEEKHSLTKSLREFFDLKAQGRPPKKFKKVFNIFNEILNSSENKNNHRKLKTLNIAMRTLKEHGRIVKGTMVDGKNEFFYKKTYGELVTDIWENDDDISKETDRKRKQNLRKSKQRLKERTYKVRK